MKYKGPERREFLRLDYAVPINFKVCKKETFSKIVDGYTVDISQAGLLCKIKEPVKKNDLLWLVFDRSTLIVCNEVESRSLIYQNGIIGKVVRVDPKKNGQYNVGVRFVTREEKNLTNVFPKARFLEGQNS